MASGSTKEEPDGEPDRGRAQVLRRVVMGAFEISDGKIKAWRDYFDQNQFTSRMG